MRSLSMYHVLCRESHEARSGKTATTSTFLPRFASHLLTSDALCMVKTPESKRRPLGRVEEVGGLLGGVVGLGAGMVGAGVVGAGVGGAGVAPALPTDLTTSAETSGESFVAEKPRSRRPSVTVTRKVRSYARPLPTAL